MPSRQHRREIRTCALLLLALVVAPGATASESEVRRAVDALVARLARARVTDLAIEQTVTLYHPDGRHPQSTGEQVLYLKPPGRQRLEQTIDGRREVRLTVGDRAWVRRVDGRVQEAATAAPGRGRSDLVSPLWRSAGDLLAEWKALGVREEVSHLLQLRGRPVLVVGAGPGDRSSPAVWLDELYGVIRVTTHERLPQGLTLMDLALSEHRALLDGFHFPYRQELFANGRLLLRVVVRTVNVNRSLPDTLFDPEALGQEP